MEKKIAEEIITYDDFQEMDVNYGYLNKKVIEEEVRKNPQNFMKAKEAVKHKNSNKRIFILGKLGESLENMSLNPLFFT